jgi:hypothetical protein
MSFRGGEPSPWRPSGRPVPDYSRRGTKLKLFVLVAAAMLVLVAIDWARKPNSWQWLWQLDKLAERDEEVNDRLPDPPPGEAGETLVSMDPPASLPAEAALDPVARAWQQGWKDVYDRLEAPERELLFQIVYVAANRQALPPAKSESAAELLARATALWEDYQAAAFQSIAQLTGDDQLLWVDVLRQVNGRFANDLSPAIQSVIDGRTPTEAEERALAGLAETLVALTSARIEDDTVFRPAEREIWFHRLALVRDRSAEELRQRSAGRVAYLQLFKQPDEYRGKVVSVKGTVRLAYRVQAPGNYLGIKEYFVYWIHPEGGPTSPIVVYALAAPPDFPEIHDKDLDRRTTKLNEDVEVTGVFFKRWAYPAKDGTYTAPLVVANVPDWRPSALALAGAETNIRPAEIGAVALAALLIAVCLAVVIWYRTRRRRPADEFVPPNIAALGNLSLAPTTQESLRQLERESQGGA